MPPAKRPKAPIPFSATKLVASTPASRLAFRKKLGITTPAKSRGQALANRRRISAAKKKVIPHRTPEAIKARTADRQLRKNGTGTGW